MADALKESMAMGEPDPKIMARIAVLQEEMDAIHYANSLYWKQGQGRLLQKEPSTSSGANDWNRSGSSLPNFRQNKFATAFGERACCSESSDPP
jgi:hypothetical protein